MAKRSENIKSRVEKKLAPVREQLDTLLAAGRATDAVNMVYAALVEALVHASNAAYGKKSERVDPDQLKLLLEHKNEEQDAEVLSGEPVEDAPAEDDATGAEATEPEPPPKRRHKHGRGKLPEDLPRETCIHEVPESERLCPHCQLERRVIGYETSEVLELVPAHFKVIVHQREKLACVECRASGVTVADVPDKPFERSLAGPGLLAHLAVSKFFDHMPLTRIRRSFFRLGVDVAVTTMSAWLARLASVLKPVLERMWELLLESHVVQTDASGLRVLDRKSEDNIALGTMWCHVGDYQIVVFRYAEDGTGAKGPWKWLAGRTGYVQSDGSNIFMRVHNGRAATAIPVGCWFHARRPFFAQLDKDPDAAVAVDYIQRLYRIEAKAEEQGLDHHGIRDLRQAESLPILEDFRRWIDGRRRIHTPRSALGGGLAYLVNHWAALLRYTEDGRLRMDNNICEGQIRDLALGRKNFLFAGSHAAAEHVALFYSLMRSCARCGANPYEYLRDVMTRLGGGWPPSRIDELLPHRWVEQAKQQPQANPA